MATGKVVQVIGTVVDIEFPADELPNLFDALELDNVGEKLTLEVQQHVGNNWVRCLALGATDGLARGVEVNDTGQKVSVPVGPETLGRLFDVLGEPLDNLGPLETAQKCPIHRDPPPFAHRVQPAAAPPDRNRTTTSAPRNLLTRAADAAGGRPARRRAVRRLPCGARSTRRSAA